MTPRRIWLILFLVACALRLPDVGNPLVDVDEGATAPEGDEAALQAAG